MPTRNRKPSVMQLTAEYRPSWIQEADRRYRSVQSVLRAREALFDDLGGFDAVSVAKQMIVDRAVFMCLRLMELERKVLQEEEIDWSHYAYVSNQFMGLLKALGLERQPKAVGNLRDYLEAEQ